MSTRRVLAGALMLAASVTAAAHAIDQAQGSPALKIVVIDGEAGINIIQQNTAVKPVIEVRDRNNLPVPGVLVTFSIEGGKAATFGGASTLTVATNAAGQAAVSSLTPTAAGAFQIQVSAAFQGQIASATIAQTNVMTAAQAAAAAGSAASGSAGSGAGAGGGAGGAAGGAGSAVSATTVAVAGAAVAGGALAAKQITSDKDAAPDLQKFSGPFTSTLVETVTSRNTGQSCTITRSVTGTATMVIDANNPSNVDGDLNLQATSTPVAFTCGNSQPTTQFGTAVKVSGATSALRGSSTTPSTSSGPNGETITGTLISTFDGSINGTTMNGTMVLDMRSQSTGGSGGPVESSQQTTISLTLTKS